MRRLFLAWGRLNQHLSHDLFGGPKVVKAAWAINLQKAGTLPFVLVLMACYGVWSTTAWVYAALHGSYGLLWLLKDRVFPDRNWEERVTFGSAIAMCALVLGPYWVAPWLIVAFDISASPALLGGATILYALGVTTMMASDCQKHFTLQLKRGLITTGWFARVRHPNYLGEMALYASFALLAQHWIPWAILAWVWIGVFTPNMVMKEASMARYDEWPAYVRRTGMLLPRLMKTREQLRALQGAQ